MKTLRNILEILLLFNFLICVFWFNMAALSVILMMNIRFTYFFANNNHYVFMLCSILLMSLQLPLWSTVLLTYISRKGGLVNILLSLIIAIVCISYYSSTLMSHLIYGFFIFIYSLTTPMHPTRSTISRRVGMLFILGFFFSNIWRIITRQSFLIEYLDSIRSNVTCQNTSISKGLYYNQIKWQFLKKYYHLGIKPIDCFSMIIKDNYFVIPISHTMVSNFFNMWSYKFIHDQIVGRSKSVLNQNMQDVKNQNLWFLSDRCLQLLWPKTIYGESKKFTCWINSTMWFKSEINSLFNINLLKSNKHNLLKSPDIFLFTTLHGWWFKDDLINKLSLLTNNFLKSQDLIVDVPSLQLSQTIILLEHEMYRQSHSTKTRAWWDSISKYGITLVEWWNYTGIVRFFTDDLLHSTLNTMMCLVTGWAHGYQPISQIEEDYVYHICKGVSDRMLEEIQEGTRKPWERIVVTDMLEQQLNLSFNEEFHQEFLLCCLEEINITYNKVVNECLRSALWIKDPVVGNPNMLLVDYHNRLTNNMYAQMETVYQQHQTNLWNMMYSSYNDKLSRRIEYLVQEAGRSQWSINMILRQEVKSLKGWWGSYTHKVSEGWEYPFLKDNKEEINTYAVNFVKHLEFEIT